MTPDTLRQKLEELLALPAETEWIEFKKVAGQNYSSDKIGKYFSALSNEANLKEQQYGWLIFGVQDKPRKIVGTKYGRNQKHLENLKYKIAEQTGNRLTFEHIFDLETEHGRVVIFQIPPALKGMPTAWQGHFFGRDGESLGPLNIHELEQIRAQIDRKDWSAMVAPEACLDDLDPAAILFARDQYKERHPKRADDIDQWDDITFLNKAKICVSGKITHTALILLGREEAAHFLSPAVAQIVWVLKAEDNIERDYRHFYPPFILAVDQVLDKIRNLTYRYLPNATLFPLEVSQYDPWVIRETLHNCIAHQDYAKSGRINIIEYPESLLVTNLGHFIPGSIEEIICRDSPPEEYRNRFLAEAMVQLNMIDTIGSGIKRMFTVQRERFFPMPDYNFDDPERVKVGLFGKILDENYTRMLIEQGDLDLFRVMALDKVQKKKPLTDDEFRQLKKYKLIEGRRPNIYVSAKVAALTDDKASYIKHRELDKSHYKKLIADYLQKFGSSPRKDIDAFMLDKLSDALSHKQKKDKIRNLLQEMRRQGVIERGEKTSSGARWELSKT